MQYFMFYLNQFINALSNPVTWGFILAAIAILYVIFNAHKWIGGKNRYHTMGKDKHNDRMQQAREEAEKDKRDHPEKYI